MAKRKANASKASKAVLRYAESYHMPGLKIKDFCLPTLPSATPGFDVVEAYVMKAGTLERGSETFEFQDVRIYLRESAGAVDPQAESTGKPTPRDPSSSSS